MDALKERAEAPTTNDHLFKSIVSKRDTENDKTWYPYTYQTLKCFDCHVDTGYREKFWFWDFCPKPPYFVLCKTCQDDKKN